MSLRETDNVLEEIKEELARREVSTLEDAQLVMDEITTRRNRAPQMRFCGLSPEAVHRFLHFPFESTGFVEFRSVVAGSDVTSRIGRLFLLLAAAIGEDGVKTTATGNLPRSMVRSIAAESMTEEQLVEMTQTARIQTEMDFHDLHVTRIVGQQSGLIRKLNGRFVVTKACRKLLADSGLAEIYPRLFRAYTTRYNWGYSSRGPEIPFVQRAFVFSLYLLHRFGDEWRAPAFYEDAFLQAFPSVLEEIVDLPYMSGEALLRLIFQLEFLSRFCEFFGLIEASHHSTFRREMTAVRKTSFFNEVVRFHIQDAAC